MNEELVLEKKNHDKEQWSSEERNRRNEKEIIGGNKNERRGENKHRIEENEKK